MVTEHSYIRTLREQLVASTISRREFLRTATLLGLSASAAYEFANRVGGDAAGQAFAQAIPKGGRVRIGLHVGAVKTPHSNDVAEHSNIIRATCEYLTRTGHDNITRPYLLGGWQVSDDLRVWTLRVRRGVRWRKGRPFLADDVVWNLKHVLDPKTGSSMVGLMKSYLLNDQGALWDANAIGKVDDYTVRLNLRRPHLALPEDVFNHPMAIVDPQEGGTFGPGVNGTGPFELVELEPKKKAVFKARSDYWGTGPYLDTLEYVDLGDDPATYVAALASKQVDGLYSFEPGEYEVYGRLPDVQIYEATTAETAVVRGKVTVKPFDDPRVRRALRLAIDPKDVVATALRGRGQVAEHHHVSPIHPEYTPLPMQRNVAEAKRLLADAGYPNGFEAELVLSQQPSWIPQAAENMVEQWKDAGIRVSLKVVPYTMYIEVWNKVPFGFTRWGHRPLGIMTLATAYRSGAPWNESGYNNPRFDELLATAAGTADVAKRQELVKEIERIMQEDGPIVQPAWKTVLTAYHKRVKGFRIHPTLYIYPEELGVS